ncbi:DUF6891 domain-containing protein [Kribbella deserti]|uniref:DUF6891 domain-containing protein n=1 Tax=Kribbella deserti TaxID=1926257 RepID=A0ABV6QRX4_9ACTN
MGFLDRFRRSAASSDAAASGPPPASVSAGAVASAGASAEVEDALREQLVDWIRPGFLDRDEVLDRARDYFEGEDESIPDERITVLVDEAWAARLAEQRMWTGESDAERLEAAFEHLENSGVVARMNFTCCQTCGVAEIGDERPDPSYAGYVFFHQQDAERLADPDPHLFLAYGAFDTTRENYVAKDEAIGRQITVALTQAGLPHTWTGSATERISVGPLTWHRPLPD